MTDPRNISPRTDAFLATLGPYISAIEKYAHDAPFLVKGLSLPQRDKKMSNLLNFDAFLETDYTRYDMTMSAAMMRQVEMAVFAHCFDMDEHPLLMQALELAVNTKGVADNGLFYLVEGTRCSGDAHTSLGNVIQNAFNTWLVLRQLPTGSWVGYHEGDDGLVGFNAQCEDLVNMLVTQLACLGFQVKVLTTRVLEDVTFCGRFVAHTTRGLKSFCDVKRTLAKFHVTLSNGQNLQQLLKAKCLSYRDTDKHTPIVGPLVQSIARMFKDLSMSDSVLRYTAKSRRHLFLENFSTIVIDDYEAPVLEELRSVVTRRTGWSPRQQEEFEEMTREWARNGFVPAEFPRLPGGDQLLDGPDRTTHLGFDGLDLLF